MSMFYVTERTAKQAFNVKSTVFCCVFGGTVSRNAAMRFLHVCESDSDGRNDPLILMATRRAAYLLVYLRIQKHQSRSSNYLVQ